MTPEANSKGSALRSVVTIFRIPFVSFRFVSILLTRLLGAVVYI